MLQGKKEGDWVSGWWIKLASLWDLRELQRTQLYKCLILKAALKKGVKTWTGNVQHLKVFTIWCHLGTEARKNTAIQEKKPEEVSRNIFLPLYFLSFHQLGEASFVAFECLLWTIAGLVYQLLQIRVNEKSAAAHLLLFHWPSHINIFNSHISSWLSAND